MTSQQFSLCWDNFHKNMSTGMQSLLETEALVDVTLAVEGRYLKAHKMLLSVCSPYFRELFQSNPCQHPIVFMKDVSYVALTDLLHFMYQGEVKISQKNLSTFIKTAEALQIKGLTHEMVQNDSQSAQEIQKSTEKTTEKRPHDSNAEKVCDSSPPKKFFGSTSKRPKKHCNFTATPTPISNLPVQTETNYEFLSVESCVDLKLEPIECIEPTQTDTADECQLTQYSDEVDIFKMDNEIEEKVTEPSTILEPNSNHDQDEFNEPGNTNENASSGSDFSDDDTCDNNRTSRNVSLASAVTVEPSTLRFSSPSASTHLSLNNDIRHLLETLVTKVESISSTQQQHSLVLTKFLSANQANNALNKPSDIPTLPIENKQEYKAFEDFLQNQDKFNYMKCRLACIGGTNVRNAVMNMLKFMLSDEVAMRFNWAGRDNRKRAFKDTLMSKVIQEAAITAFSKQEECHDLNDRCMQDAIKDWLKLAKHRFENKAKKLRQN